MFIDFDPEYWIPTSVLYYSNESLRLELNVVYSDDDEFDLLNILALKHKFF